MTEPIIASLTDPEAGLVEHLMQAQLLINERDAYKRALYLRCACEFDEYGDSPSAEATEKDAQEWYREAAKQLESEEIDSGKVA